MTNPKYNLGIEFAVGSLTDITQYCTRMSYSRSIADVLTSIRADEAIIEITNDVGSMSPLLNLNLAAGRKIGLKANTRSKYLWLPGILENYAYTPDDSKFDITGNITLIAYIEPQPWLRTANTTICAKWNTTGNRSYQFQIISTGALTFQISPDGAAAPTYLATSSVVLTGGAKWVKVTRNSSTGDVTFYSSDKQYNDIPSWEQLGATQSTPINTMFSGTAPFEIGQQNSANVFTGKIWYVAVYNDTSLVGEFVPERDCPTEGVTSFNSKTTGELWTIGTTGTYNKAAIRIGDDYEGVFQALGTANTVNHLLVNSGPAGLSSTKFSIEVDFSISSYYQNLDLMFGSNFSTGNALATGVTSALGYYVGVTQQGSQSYTVIPSSTIFLNRRELVHATWGGSKIAAYVNGVMTGVGSTLSSSLHTGAMLGVAQSPATYYGVRMWNRVLSASEVLDRFLGRDVSNDGLILNLDFGTRVTNSGDIMRDISGANNNAVTVNSYSWSNVGSQYSLYSGRVSNIFTRPSFQDRTTVFEAMNEVELLERTLLTTPMLVRYSLNSLFVEIMSRSLVSSYFTVAGLPTADFAWYDERNAKNAVDQILKSSWLEYYIDGAGTHRLQERSTGFWYTGNNSIPPSVSASLDKFYDLNYTVGNQGIINKVQVGGIPRLQDTNVATVAFLQGQSSLIPGSGFALEFFVTYLDPRNVSATTPVGSIITPVQSTDYQVRANTDGTGPNYTASTSLTMTSFGESAKVRIVSAVSTTGFLSKFNVRGYPILAGTDLSIEADASSSQTAYGINQLVIDDSLVPRIPNLIDLATNVLTITSQPKDNLTLTLVNQFSDQFNIDIAKVIGVVNSQTGVNSLWEVRGSKTDIEFSRGLAHATTYTLERFVQPVPLEALGVQFNNNQDSGGVNSYQTLLFNTAVYSEAATTFIYPSNSAYPMNSMSNTNQKAILSFWINPKSLGGWQGASYQVVMNLSGGALSHVRAFNNSGSTYLSVIEVTSGGTTCVTAVASLTQEVWNHFLCSWDTGLPLENGGVTVALNGISIEVKSGSGNFNTNQTIVYGAMSNGVPFGGRYPCLGGQLTTVVRTDAPTRGFIGDLAEIYWNQGEYLDFRSVYNVRRFVSPTNRPVDLGSLGERPTGNQPILYTSIRGANTPGSFDVTTQISLNRGYGGNWKTAVGSIHPSTTIPGQYRFRVSSTSPSGYNIKY